MIRKRDKFWGGFEKQSALQLRWSWAADYHGWTMRSATYHVHWHTCRQLHHDINNHSTTTPFHVIWITGDPLYEHLIYYKFSIGLKHDSITMVGQKLNHGSFMAWLPRPKCAQASNHGNWNVVWRLLLNRGFESPVMLQFNMAKKHRDDYSKNTVAIP